MIKYAVVEIAGRQYKVSPNQTITVDSLGDSSEFECEKVLLVSDGEKLEVGSPYLKNKLKFKVLETTKEKKIRVATYHAKANYRRVKGSRRHVSKVQLVA